MPVLDLVAVPAPRAANARRLAAALRPGMRVAISTHMSADGDACGSEVGFALLLSALGCRPHIVNPTPWPAMFDFLRAGDVDDRTPDGPSALDGIDLLVVLDVGDVGRLGGLAERVRRLRVPRLVVDHHVAGDEPAGEPVLVDTTACATGELVFDFASTLDLPLAPPVARALYCAILTDTGGFRFSNTSPRCHAIAGQLLAAGVDPEEMYRRVYASVPVGRLHLLREALATLRVDGALGLSWLSVPADATERFGVKSEDLDGIVEHARSVAGTRLALFFRDLGHGKVKVSFRSAGGVDVSAFAKRFGGGGHARAAGALLAGDLPSVQRTVIGAAREYLAGARASADGSPP